MSFYLYSLIYLPLIDGESLLHFASGLLIVRIQVFCYIKFQVWIVHSAGGRVRYGGGGITWKFNNLLEL